MNPHLHTQLHSRIALDCHICEHRVRARMHREGPYRSPGHCWAGTMDEVPAENRMNKIIRTLDQLAFSKILLQNPKENINNK